MRKQLTIKDVARLAGVSAMTVSRALNRSGYVAEEMRTRVESAAKELGYVPNHLARGLRSRRTDTLALVLTDITNPFFTTVARGVEDAASDAGNLVLVCNTDESEAEESRYLRMLVQKQVDGVILVPAGSGKAPIDFALHHGMRVVVLDRVTEHTDVDLVRCDATEGANQLGKLLRELGHRKLGILAGRKGISTSDDRVFGFLRAFQESNGDLISQGIDLEVIHGDFTHFSGEQMASQLLARRPFTTAIFAVNNFIAVGAIREIRRRGLSIPEDIAIVGYDDFLPSLFIDPFLTSVFQPAYDMGHRAVEILLARLNETTASPRQEVLLPTELIVRRSSGGPRH